MSLLRLSSTLLLNAFKTDVGCTRNVARWVAPTLRELRKRRQKIGPLPVMPRSSYLEWNFNAELFAFGKRLDESFDSKLLQQAFTHRSFLVQEELKQRNVGIEDPVTNISDNSTLIEEGEKIISDYVEAFLMANLPKMPSAGIKAIRNYLLSDKVLANISSHLGTKDIILSSDFPVNESTLASTFKAVVAALQESSGEERATEFVRDFVCTQLSQRDINEFWIIDDPLNFLEELCRDKKLAKPEPRLIGKIGQNTILAAYNVGIYCDKKLMGTGFGEDIDTAIETAACDCLRELFGTQTNMKPLNFQIDLSEITKRMKKASKL